MQILFLWKFCERVLPRRAGNAQASYLACGTVIPDEGVNALDTVLSIY